MTITEWQRPLGIEECNSLPTTNLCIQSAYLVFMATLILHWFLSCEKSLPLHFFSFLFPQFFSCLLQFVTLISYPHFFSICLSGISYFFSDFTQGCVSRSMSSLFGSFDFLQGFTKICALLVFTSTTAASFSLLALPRPYSLHQWLQHRSHSWLSLVFFSHYVLRILLSAKKSSIKLYSGK